MPAGWDFLAAHKLARQRMAKAAGLTVGEFDRQQREIDDGVGRGRRRFELAAPAVANLMTALVLGTDPHELDRMRGGARLLLEGCKASLAIVGLRAGESQELDVSDRMQQFLSGWFGGEERKVIDVTPGDAEHRKLT